jgi:L-serine dehydratase
MKKYPSIFNDVIGPVMRGPSSSHCAASLRIARLCRDIMEGNMNHILIEFDPDGSLATTHKSQGSDMGLFGGFLGWEADDERLPESEKFLEMAGISVDLQIVDIGATHPNTYKLTLSNSRETHVVTAISTGGGMIEVIAIDGAVVSMAGDFFETIIYCNEPDTLVTYLKTAIEYDEITIHDAETAFIEIKAQQFFDQTIAQEIMTFPGVTMIRKLNPVLPVLSRKNLEVPFVSCEEMLAYNEGRNLSLWQLAVAYEQARGNISEEEVLNKMKKIVRIMQASIDSGLRGTKYADRLLGPQSVRFKQQLEDKKLLTSGLMNKVIMYTSAMMEVKSSMGVIVAAPTAGSCGALPGAILGVVAEMGLPEEEAVKAMLAAAMIGVFIAEHAPFAAEVGGCQAECGSGAGMAAAGIVYMASGTLQQSLSAASIALQNSLGMICDPIANRVEAPCLGKNILAATNALSCANMALADYDHLIPLDEVIDTMRAVGDSIPHTLRCTTLGGLSITKTSKELEARLNSGAPVFFKSC